MRFISLLGNQFQSFDESETIIMSNNLNDVLDGLRGDYNGRGGDFEWSGNSDFLDPASAEADALASIPQLAEWVLRHKGINIVRGDVDVSHRTVNHWQEYHIPFDGTGTIPGPNTYLGYVAWLPHDTPLEKSEKQLAPTFFSVDGMLFSLKMQVEQLQLRVAALEGSKAPQEAKARLSDTISDESTLKATRLGYDEVRTLIEANNNSSLTTELLTCLIWKESGFDPNAHSASSTATGLMQMTVGAVQDVNHNTPQGIHFEHSEMTTPARNIACGTYYLAILIRRWGNVTAGLEHYGTGTGYADNILRCEGCIRGNPSGHQQCLNAIHS